MNRNNAAVTKKALERAIFERFARDAGLVIPLDSIYQSDIRTGEPPLFGMHAMINYQRGCSIQMSRSYAPITQADLRRLATLAADDRRDLFKRRPDTGRLYGGRLFAVALCQGGALHFIDGRTGIKDLDIWSFYDQHPERQFPPRRRKEVDFGDQKFGTSEGSSHFIGRRVDLIGRSIPNVDRSDPVATLRRYLSARRTATARRLAEKAMILIEPSRLLGTVVWPE